MMKFLILSLLALSASFSESKDVSKDDPKNGYTPKEVLKVYFNITEEDLSAKCDKVDDKTRWNKVYPALGSLQDVALGIIADVEKEAKKSTKATDDVYDDLIKTRCLNNDAFKQGKTNLIKAALPCVTKDKLAEILKYSLSYSCELYKKEAKEKNGSQ